MGNGFSERWHFGFNDETSTRRIEGGVVKHFTSADDEKGKRLAMVSIIGA